MNTPSTYMITPGGETFFTRLLGGQIFFACVACVPRGGSNNKYFTTTTQDSSIMPLLFAIDFEEIPSYFVLNVFSWLLCTIKWFQLWIDLHNINLLDNFLSKFGYLNPWGAHICYYPHCFAINSEKIANALFWMYFCVYFAW